MAPLRRSAAGWLLRAAERARAAEVMRSPYYARSWEALDACMRTANRAAGVAPAS
jgi:hypothetical protein